MSMLSPPDPECHCAPWQYYLWDTDLIADYFNTRNGMLGGDYSTKFAPWLAHGCLSPRTIYAEIQRYQQQRTKNKSTYWVIFELIWRDFYKCATSPPSPPNAWLLCGTFVERHWQTLLMPPACSCRFYALKHGNSIFLEDGPEGRAPQWAPNQDELFQRWRTGKTGMPLVDANMRELNATGGLQDPRELPLPAPALFLPPPTTVTTPFTAWLH